MFWVYAADTALRSEKSTVKDELYDRHRHGMAWHDEGKDPLKRKELYQKPSVAVSYSTSSSNHKVGGRDGQQTPSQIEDFHSSIRDSRTANPKTKDTTSTITGIKAPDGCGYNTWYRCAQSINGTAACEKFHPPLGAPGSCTESTAIHEYDIGASFDSAMRVDGWENRELTDTSAFTALRELQGGIGNIHQMFQRQAATSG